MPFGKKPAGFRAPEIPETIDFDALWNKSLLPVITDLGYDPVRADQDTGASIIMEMLERLFFSDLVIADMTLPNGNVYYEIGIRHASRRTGCLLMSADWAKPLSDIAQMCRLRTHCPKESSRTRMPKRFGSRSQLVSRRSPTGRPRCSNTFPALPTPSAST